VEVLLVGFRIFWSGAKTAEKSFAGFAGAGFLAEEAMFFLVIGTSPGNDSAYASI